MALAPDDLGAGAVPTSETDIASAVPGGKTWQALPGVFANDSGAARTVTVKKIAADGTTVLMKITRDIPSDGSEVQIATTWPLLASQKMRWIASGANVYGDVPVVKN